MDGWGSLTTPYGTFDVIRVRSEITAHDSIYADTLGIGFSFDPPLAIEYKWLGAGQRIPLLQINTTIPAFGTETITSITYRDSVRTTGIDQPSTVTGSFGIYPNPSSGALLMDIISTKTTPGEVRLISVTGKLVAAIWKGTLYEGSNKIAVNTALYGVAAGNYIAELKAGESVVKQRLVIVGSE